MGQMWWFWVRNRWCGIGGVLIGLLALLVVGLIVTGGSERASTFLGNAAAPRALVAQDSGNTTLPRDGQPGAEFGAVPDIKASVLDTTAPSAAGPQSVQAARASWSAEEIARRQNEVLAAYNCARAARGMSPVALDPALSQIAADAWLRLARDHSFSLAALPGAYTMRAVLALDFAAPDAVAQHRRERPIADSAMRCGVGTLDATALPLIPASTTIGIAVFPPQAPWDLVSAVLLVD